MSELTHVKVPITHKQLNKLTRIAKRERITVEWMLHEYIRDLAIMYLSDE